MKSNDENRHAHDQFEGEGALGIINAAAAAIPEAVASGIEVLRENQQEVGSGEGGVDASISASANKGAEPTKTMSTADLESTLPTSVSATDVFNRKNTYGDLKGGY